MTTPARRADAVDNRHRIVAAARAALAESDGAREKINLRLIAQAAGVGQGTLYRHFPSREHLMVEVYREEVGELVDVVPTLLDVHQPLVALELWFAQVVDHARVKRGVIAALETSTWHGLHTAEHTRLERALEALLERGKLDGVIRREIDATEVLLLLGALSRLPQAQWDSRARVIVAVILDGLAHRP